MQELELSKSLYEQIKADYNECLEMLQELNNQKEKEVGDME